MSRVLCEFGCERRVKYKTATLLCTSCQKLAVGCIQCVASHNLCTQCTRNETLDNIKALVREVEHNSFAFSLTNFELHAPYLWSENNTQGVRISALTVTVSAPAWGDDLYDPSVYLTKDSFVDGGKQRAWTRGDADRLRKWPVDERTKNQLMDLLAYQPMAGERGAYFDECTLYYYQS